MKKYIYTIVAVTAMFASCSQDAELNEVIDNQPKGITQVGATTWATTRAAVDGTDNTKVNWQNGDALSVFSATSTAGGSKFTTTSTGTSGTFNIVAEQPTIDAIIAMMYPYQETATWAGDKLICEIPSVQKATKGSFDKAAAIMYNIGGETEPTLTYAVNFLKVTVSETNVHAISISSSDALSGKMEITSFTITPVSGSSLNSVVLVAPANQVLEPGDYYIAVKKGVIASPTISYTYYNTANHTATVKTKAGASTISYANGKNVKPISVNFSTGTVTTRDAVQLWADGPYFAQFNVGATITDYSQANGEFNYNYGSTASQGGMYCWGGLTDFRNDGSTPDYYSGSISFGFVLPIYNDVASVLWGSNWEIPTNNSIQNLFAGIVEFGGDAKRVSNADFSAIDYKWEGTVVDWTWCSNTTPTDASKDPEPYVTGCTLPGFKVTGKGLYAGNSIFLPITGWRAPSPNYAYNCNHFGYYWTSTCDPTFPQCFSFGHQYEFSIQWYSWPPYNSALFAYPVRAVLK